MNLNDLCCQLQELTEVNAHGEAYLLAAQQLGLDDLAVKFEQINRRHLELGHLPHDLAYERHVAYQELMRKARGILMSNFHLFYSCF